MRPNLDPRLAPGKIDVGMMVLLFGDFPYTVDEFQGVAKSGNLNSFSSFCSPRTFHPPLRLVLHLFSASPFSAGVPPSQGFAFFFCKVRTHNGIVQSNPNTSQLSS